MSSWNPAIRGSPLDWGAPPAGPQHVALTHRQRGTYWCVAASAEAVARCFGVRAPQEDFVEAYFRTIETDALASTGTALAALPRAELLEAARNRPLRRACAATFLPLLRARLGRRVHVDFRDGLPAESRGLQLRQMLQRGMVVMVGLQNADGSWHAVLARGASASHLTYFDPERGEVVRPWGELRLSSDLCGFRAA